MKTKGSRCVKKKRSRASRWSSNPIEQARDRWFISGFNGVWECLHSPRVRIHELWLMPATVDPRTLQFIRDQNMRWREPDQGQTPHGPLLQGMAALVQPPPSPNLASLLGTWEQHGPTPLLLMLDQVEDPMNLGQILRTCDGAGVDAVLLPRHRSAHLNQTAAQVSQGAFAWVPVVEVGNLRNTLESLKTEGFWSFGCEADSASRPWHEPDFTGPTVLVLGAEGKGLRPLTRKTCDHLIRLPMLGKLSSLNVGAAVAALVYEVIRQRTIKEGAS